MMILWSSLDILKEATGIFMEAVPRGVDVDEVSRTIEAVDGVCEVHHIHIWSISSSQTALSCHIKVTQERTVDIPAIIAAVNRVLLERHGIDHATIQPETEQCPAGPLQSDLHHRHGDQQ